MKFTYEPALLEYMEKKGKKNIIVEVVSSDSSDFEVTELHVYLINEKQTKFFVEKKRFRSVTTAVGEVLLPPYKLEYDEEIIFGLRTFFCFKMLKYEGIRL